MTVLDSDFLTEHGLIAASSFLEPPRKPTSKPVDNDAAGYMGATATSVNRNSVIAQRRKTFFREKRATQVGLVLPGPQPGMYTSEHVDHWKEGAGGTSGYLQSTQFRLDSDGDGMGVGEGSDGGGDGGGGGDGDSGGGSRLRSTIEFDDLAETKWPDDPEETLGSTNFGALTGSAAGVGWGGDTPGKTIARSNRSGRGGGDGGGRTTRRNQTKRKGKGKGVGGGGSATLQRPQTPQTIRPQHHFKSEPASAPISALAAKAFRVVLDLHPISHVPPSFTPSFPPVANFPFTFHSQIFI
jgi:hypothetical protein